MMEWRQMTSGEVEEFCKRTGTKRWVADEGVQG